jgi:catechol 2,3-dioxygenase-like lactoylglutathione lyase family enzyme
VTSLGLIVLYCADCERSREFYATFGLDLVEEQHGEKGPVHYSAMLDGGLVLELYPAVGILPPTRTRLNIQVADPYSTAKMLREAGFDVALTVAEDPDGNAVTLVEEGQP